MLRRRFGTERIEQHQGEIDSRGSQTWAKNGQGLQVHAT